MSAEPSESADLPSNKREGEPLDEQAAKRKRTASNDRVWINIDDEGYEEDDMQSLDSGSEGGDGPDESEDIEPEQGEILWSEDKELLPLCPAYHHEVLSIKTSFTEISRNIENSLKAIDNGSEAMKKLLRQAAEVREFPKPKVPIIAFLGAAGAGKSSLMSMLLDTPHVSREGNFGKSCTCVIIEYQKAFPEQTFQFAARIEFLSTQQRETLLKDHLQEYMNYHFDKDDKWTEEEERDFCAQAKSAAGTFLDLFRGKPGFNDYKTFNTYMQGVYEKGTSAATLNQLEMWCKELVVEHRLCSDTGLIESRSAYQLTKKLGPFLTSSAAWCDKPSLWPIVHKISYGIQGPPRVLEHMIIADLPGLSDSNRVRVRASKAYLRKSDYLWIVTNIGRCITDTTVDSLLYEWGERFASRITIVATRIDETGTSASFLQEFPDAEQPLRKVDASLRKAKATYSEAKKLLRSAIAPLTRENRDKEAERCRLRYEAILKQRLVVMVQYRNKKVQAEMYAEKSDRLQESGPDVIHCVSNKHYAWLKGYRDIGSENAPQLSAAMTGIPRLRKYALCIPSQDVWDDMMSHICHTGVAFIKAVRMWVSRADGEDDIGLSEARTKSTKAMDDALKGYRASVSLEAARLLVLSMEHVQDEVARIADDYFATVRQEWHWCSIKACIRKSGTHMSPAVGSVSWNKKLMVLVIRLIECNWPKLIDNEAGSLDATEATILTVLDAILDGLKENMEVLQIPLGAFEGFFEAQKRGITHAFKQYREEFKKEVKNIKHLLTKDDDQGYLAVAMEDAYAEARQITGKGYKNNVMDILQDHVNRKGAASPFTRMARAAAAQFCKSANNCMANLQDWCTRIFNEIFDQFSGLIDDTVDADGSIARAKASLTDLLATADTEVADMIRKLEAIKKDPRPPRVVRGSEAESSHSNRVRVNNDTSPGSANKVGLEAETSRIKVEEEPQPDIKEEPTEPVHLTTDTE